MQDPTNNLNPPGVFNATGGGGGQYFLRSDQIFSRGFRESISLCVCLNISFVCFYLAKISQC